MTQKRELKRIPQMQRVPFTGSFEVSADLASVYWCVTAVDCHGRLGDRSVVRFMDWARGKPLWIGLRRQVVEISECPPGSTYSITPQGYIMLPLGIRRGLRIEAGERLLVVADSERGRILACKCRLLGPALEALMSDSE